MNTSKTLKGRLATKLAEFDGRTGNHYYWTLTITAVVLGLFSIVAALVITLFSYHRSIKDTEQRYYDFYLKEAKMIVASIQAHKDQSDELVMQTVMYEWDSIKERPADEHICIVDSNSRLLLHSVLPEAVSAYIGDNLLQDAAGEQTLRFRDIIESGRDYVGRCVSIKGQQEIAAFAYEPQRKWIVGVHRSTDAMLNEIESGVRPLFIALILVCGLLIPVSLFILYWVFILTQRGRRRTEEALKKSETLFREFFENNPAIVFLKDCQGRFLLVNPVYEQIFKVKNDELVGKTDYDLFPLEAADCYQKNDQQVIDQGQVILFDEDVPLDDGTHTYISIKFPLYNADGEIYGVGGASTDITDRKLAEEEREKLIKTLEQQNAELERFTYTVSHDLKSPLVTIQGFLGLLEQDALAGDIEKMREDMQRIDTAAEKMHTLLMNLLELSRIGRLVNPAEDISLHDIAYTYVMSVDMVIKEHGITVYIAPEMPLVFGDPLRLHEVLQNLIDNAIKFVCDQPNPHIEIGVRKDGEETVFYVKDNGIGIDPQYQERVFNLFEQLDQQRKGTGIGLAIVKRIIEFHGGRIWVESEGVGHGASFCFTLPVGVNDE